MKMGVTFTEKEKEVFKELNELHDKIKDDTLFDCHDFDCSICPFHTDDCLCVINEFCRALKTFTEKQNEGK